MKIKYKNNFIKFDKKYKTQTLEFQNQLFFVYNLLEDYKKAILQESEKAIKYFKETNQHDKYISFKIGDEFTAISGKGSFNKMKKEGLCSDEYNEELGFIYPCLDASSSNNHIKGFTKTYNNDSCTIKVVKDGAGAGKTKFFYEKIFVSGGATLLSSNTFSNEYTSLFLSKKLPNYNKGTTIPHCNFSDYKNEYIETPSNHEELSKKIEEINKWQIQVNETTDKMEKYIQGVLND